MDRITNLTFGEAIEYMKRGELVTRKNWNGKNMFLFIKQEQLIPLTHISTESLLPIKARHWFGDNGVGNIVFTEYICMKTADNKVVNGWLASQTDMLSNDWEVLC